MSRSERLMLWTAGLTTIEMRGLLVELVESGIDSEYVCYHDESLAPYWETTGDPLIEGQRCFPEEDT